MYKTIYCRTVIITLFQGLEGIFFHQSIIKFAKIIHNTENFCNFILGNHSEINRKLYFVELTLS